MSQRSTETLLRELQEGLRPVRPIPRLRSMLLATLGAFALTLGIDGLLGHPIPAFARGVAWGDPAFLGVLAGLLLTAAGGISAALAGAVPGRERVAYWGRALAGAGLLLAAAAAGGAALRGPTADSAAALVTGFECASRASALGFVPALVLCVFLARALECRPRVGAAVAASGAVALGAAAVHASCADSGGLHMLLGHWLTPFGIALLLAWPLSLLVRLASRRT